MHMPAGGVPLNKPAQVTVQMHSGRGWNCLPDEQTHSRPSIHSGTALGVGKQEIYSCAAALAGTAASSRVLFFSTSLKASMLSPSCQPLNSLQPTPHSLPCSTVSTVSFTRRSEVTLPSHTILRLRLTCSNGVTSSLSSDAVILLFRKCIKTAVPTPSGVFPPDLQKGSSAGLSFESRSRPR